MKRHSWFLPVMCLLTFVIVGMIVAVVFDALSSAKDDLWWSISRAGVGVALTTVAATVATWAFRIVDQRRARDKERRKLFNTAEKAYNDVKAARRRMLALGLREARTKPFASDEWQELREAIAVLNGAQLAFEALGKQVPNSRLFANESEILATLDEIEKYLNSKVLESWEEHGWGEWRNAGQTLPVAVDLSDFTQTSNFKSKISSMLDKLADLLREELFGKSASKPVKPISAAE